MTDQKSSNWNLGRFVNTLAYFGTIPFVGSISWLQQLLGGAPNPKPKDLMTSKQTSVVLVAGATGGLGKRVVRRLVERGYQVRSLVRDPERAREILGDATELVVGDITQPETLTAEMMSGVEAIICCTGVRVQPVEGDTPDRAKYYQGVKFYQPEVVGDTPESVEYLGVKNLVQAATKQLKSVHTVDEKVIFDFCQPSYDLKETWGALDDVVMGGVSESNIRLMDSVALFSGNVSTANSGGFASVRTRNFEPPFNLTGYEGVVLHVKGDGNRYKFMLRSEDQWDGTAYCYSFDTTADSWIDVRIPFTDLIPVFRAKTVKEASPLDSSQICSFQLMLSKFEYDGALNPKFEPGSFQIQVASIKAYKSAVLPRFVMVSSAGVTRPGRPGIDLEQEPPAVRMNDQLGGILTWKLRGEDSVRESGIPYTIIRPCALTEEEGGRSLKFDQGDNLKGKASREDIAELCIRSLKQPSACNVTFEVAEGENSCAPGDWQCLFTKLKIDRQPDILHKAAL